MKLRRFNRRGVERFTAWIESLRADQMTPDLDELLCDDTYSVDHPAEIDVEVLSCSQRFELGCALVTQLKSIDPGKAYDDTGLWSWLAYLNRDILLPRRGRGRKRPGELARYVPSREWNKRYRHLLRGPWHVVNLHPEDPDCLRAILCNAPDVPGELYEQLASRLDLVASGGVMGALSKLYYDAEENRLRRGALGKKSGGTARRFGKLINQLNLTYHIPKTPADPLLTLLPRNEFAVSAGSEPS